MEKFNFEQERGNEALEAVLGDNFNPEKTIALKKDVDENNQEQPLGNYEAHWTEMINPDTKEVVEGKIYTPEGGPAKDILIICPGYIGDFVLQEKSYADEFCRDSRAVIVLRHNNLRIKGEDVQNFVHCPERQKMDQDYTGRGDKFSIKEANREILTVLKSMGDKIDNLDNIDILGHSWGGMIALESLMDINKEESEQSRKIVKKLNNLILLASMVDSREAIYEIYRPDLEGDARKGYFKDMNSEEIVKDLKDNGRDFNKNKLRDLPKNIKITSLNSMADKELDPADMKADMLVPFHFKLDESLSPRLIFFQDGDYGPPKAEKTLGGRGPEEHDYAGSEARRWLKKIIGNKNLKR